MSIDMSLCTIHRKPHTCSQWKRYGTNSSVLAEKLHYTLRSAIDFLMKRLDNFIEEESRQKMVDGSYEIAKHHYSYEFLWRWFHSLLT
jgi:hypothetical protein